jgi:hypothetical protein
MQIASNHLSGFNTRKVDHRASQAPQQTAIKTAGTSDSFHKASKPQFAGSSQSSAAFSFAAPLLFTGSFMSLFSSTKSTFDRVMELAQSGDSLEELKETLASGKLSDVHKANSQGQIPLMVAIQNGRKNTALLLVSWGSDPEGVTDRDGHNAYWYLDNNTTIRQEDKDAFRRKMQALREMRQEEYRDMAHLLDMQKYRDRIGKVAWHKL